MSTEPTTSSAALIAGASIGAIWFVIFLVVFIGDLAPDNREAVNGLIMVVTLFASATLIPGFRDKRFRNFKAMLFLCAGALAAVVPIFIVVFLFALRGMQFGYR